MKKFILTAILGCMVTFVMGMYAGNFVTGLCEEENVTVVKCVYDFESHRYIVHEEIKNGFGIKLADNYYTSEFRVD